MARSSRSTTRPQGARTAAPQEAENYRLAIMENLAKAGVQQAGKDDAIHFDSLTAWPGDWIAAEGRYMEGEDASAAPASSSAPNTAPSAAPTSSPPRARPPTPASTSSSPAPSTSTPTRRNSTASAASPSSTPA